MLSGYTTFSKFQLRIKCSYKWVRLELNQQRFKLLFYRQLPTPIGGPTQDTNFGRSSRNWTSIHPLKRRLQNHSANDPREVLTGVEPAITWVKTKRLKPFAYSTINWHRNWDLNSECWFWRPECCQLHHPCSWSQRRDLNLHWPRYELGALPLSYAAMSLSLRSFSKLKKLIKRLLV